MGHILVVFLLCMMFEILLYVKLKTMIFVSESEDAVMDMMYQILDAHPNSKYIHIGGDEVRP